MKGRNRERFKELCEQAEVVDDCDKLRQLSKQIDSIIETEVAQLKKRRKKSELTALSRTDHRVGH